MAYYEKKIIRLESMALDEVVELLQKNHLREGVLQVKKITIEVETSPLNGDTCSLYDILDPKPTGKYIVELEDSVMTYADSRDVCFDMDIIP